MPFYFKLKEKVYRASKQVTIGRGAPFDDLCQDRDVTRAQCEIRKSKGKFYIKSLGDKSNTYVNDEKIPRNKFVEVSLEDKIVLGEQSLELIENYSDENYIPLRSFYSPFSILSNLNYGKKWIFTSAVNILIVVISSGSDSFLSKLGFSLLAGLVGSAIWHFQSRLVGGNDEIKVNEVVAGESGLTLHYKDTNMSMKYTDIEHIYMKYKAIYIHSHNERYVLHQLKNIHELFDIILKRVSLSARNNKPATTKDEKHYPTVLITSLVVANLYIFTLFKGPGQNELMISISCFLTLVVSLLYKRSPLTSLVNSKTKNSVRKQSIYVGFAFFYVSLSSFFDYIDVNDQYANLSKCLTTDAEICKEIKYSVLISEMNSPKDTKDMINKICHVDEGTCGKLKKEYNTRSIASESD